MDKSIFKYGLNISQSQMIELPKGAEIVTVQSQRGEPVLWAMVDFPFTETHYVIIEMYGTGQTIDNDVVGERSYISTIQFKDGDLVLHVFELSKF